MNGHIENLQGKLTFCIDNILLKFKKKIDILKPLKFVAYTDGHRIEKIINRWNYIWLKYQSILLLQDRDNFPPLIETVYKMSGNREGCTGVIMIKDDGIMFTKTLGSFSYTEKKSLDDEQRYSAFLSEFNSRIENCTLTSIALRIVKKDSRHHNMLLVYNGKDRITVALYEPHGVRNIQDDDVAPMFLKNFVKAYNQSLTNKKMRAIPMVLSSCPRGFQGRVRERNYGFGYCVMYSYFWLYVILHCSSIIRKNNISDLDMETIIKSTEMIMLDKNASMSSKDSNSNSEELAIVINTFATAVIDKYITELDDLQSKVFDGKLYEYMSNYIDNEKFGGQSVMKENKIEMRDEREEKSPSNEKYGDEKYNETHEKQDFRKNGDVCNTDDVCESDVCDNGRCVPKGYGALKKRGGDRGRPY